MYERMLKKQEMPAFSDMAAYCGKNGALFTQLNGWITQTFETSQTIVFPYGKHYGWGVAHKRGKQLICNVFAEKGAFTVMLRLSNQQYSAIYRELRTDTQACIDGKYPCGDGGWIQYRVLTKENYDDIQKLLRVKCSFRRA